LTPLKWNHNVVLGITDKESVKLDFDKTPLETVKYWAFRTLSWFKLEGFIIFLSSKKDYPVEIDGNIVFKYSKKNYLVVFNRRVSWTKNVHIMDWVAIESQIPKLKDYVLMQGIKEGSTLRVSPKGDKPSPRIVDRYGRQDGEIHLFLLKRQEIKNIMRKIQKGISNQLQNKNGQETND
jgi:hypothetical protein